MQQDQKTFLKGLKSLLNYHEAIGVAGYLLNRDIGAFLQFMPHSAKEAAVVPALEVRPAGPAQKPHNKAPSARPPAVTLAEIGEEVV
ncbi:MAG TPA: hypothetical protein DDY32_06400, partial [Desulfobulbaceae bacterium]|nr:hypothetical protein [Desulfobulbaceae bacterium]